MYRLTVGAAGSGCPVEHLACDVQLTGAQAPFLHGIRNQGQLGCDDPQPGRRSRPGPEGADVIISRPQEV